MSLRVRFKQWAPNLGPDTLFRWSEKLRSMVLVYEISSVSNDSRLESRPRPIVWTVNISTANPEGLPSVVFCNFQGLQNENVKKGKVWRPSP